MASKVRVVRNSIGTEDVTKFVKSFHFAVSRGELDTHLDVLYEAIVDRIKAYQVEEGDPEDAETVSKLKAIRKLRGGPNELSVGTVYEVTGDRYRGVTVRFLGISDRSTKERQLAKVLVLTLGNVMGNGLAVDEVKLIPVAALKDLPEVPPAASETLVEKI